MGDDLISRQDAIDALGEEPEVWLENDEYELGLNNQWHYDVTALKAVPSAPRWIPVSERLPEDEVDVFVTDDSGGYATIGIDCMFTKEESGEREWLTAQRVTAWMPLPKPYNEELKLR